MGISENKVFTPKYCPKFWNFLHLLKTIVDKQNLAAMFLFGIKYKKIKSEKESNSLKDENGH